MPTAAASTGTRKVEPRFFCTAFDAQVTFQKNAAGDVIRAVFRHEGRDETAEKLNK
jgi:hypothetical protein